MALMALIQPGAAAESMVGVQAYLLVFVAGAVGAAAMILPGISGGYMLLVLGQYLVILGAIDDAKNALLGPLGVNFEAFRTTLHVFVPLILGLAVGAIGISNLIKLLLERYEKATLGLLLGLLLGAVLGLWPFQQGVAPRPGDMIKGRVMTPELIVRVDPKDYPLETFTPSAAQIAGAFLLVGAGFGVTQGVALLGRES
jgi:putative membrane protein